MDEKNYEMAFQLIMNAGNSKSASVMAQEAAKKFDFDQADQHLKDAELEMRKAHQCQTVSYTHLTLPTIRLV